MKNSLSRASRTLCSITVLLALAGTHPAAAAADVLSPKVDAAVPDQSDASREGSLAWWISKSSTPQARAARIQLPPAHVYHVKSDLAVPAHIALRIPRGAILNVAETATLTLDGVIDAGSYRIFEGNGSVAGKPQVDYVRPQWWGKDRKALQSALRFSAVFLGRDTFTVDGDLEIRSNTHLFGEPGAQIVCTLSGNPHNYYGILMTPKSERVQNIRVEGIKFVNTEAVGLYALAVNYPLGGEDIQFNDCESVGCGLIVAINVKRITVSDSICHSSTLDKLDIFDDHHDGIYVGGKVEDCIIRNNRVLDRRCHGIAVVADSIYHDPTKDPEREMPGKRILVEGNTVVSGSGQLKTAGGIWFSCVQDCRVLNNHVEEYGDVGIDFEGSRNCIADSNILINNNKNLALYGNCRNITFSNNIVYMTRAYTTEEGGELTSCAFMNTYSNGYPGHTDLRNSDIFVTGNLFSVNTEEPAKSWMGGIVAGTARRIYFRDNVFVNCHFESHFCHDLETIEIVNNSFFNDRTGGGNVPLFLAVAENDPEEKQPTKNFIIRGNRFRLADDAKVPAVIQIGTRAVIHSVPTQPFCDLNVVIENNVIQRDTATQPSVLFIDNYQGGHRADMAIRCVVRNNVTTGRIAFDIPEEMRETLELITENNAELLP